MGYNILHIIIVFCLVILNIYLIILLSLNRTAYDNSQKMGKSVGIGGFL